MRELIPSGVAVVLMACAGIAAAQTPQPAPRFEGSRTAASSASVQSGQGALRDGGDLGAYNQQIFGQPLPQALFGAAALEAAREEGRRYVERRHAAQDDVGDDVEVPEADVSDSPPDDGQSDDWPRIRWSRSGSDRLSDGDQTDMQTYFISR